MGWKKRKDGGHDSTISIIDKILKETRSADRVARQFGVFHYTPTHEWSLMAIQYTVESSGYGSVKVQREEHSDSRVTKTTVWSCPAAMEHVAVAVAKAMNTEHNYVLQVLEPAAVLNEAAEMVVKKLNKTADEVGVMPERNDDGEWVWYDSSGERQTSPTFVSAINAKAKDRKS